jgi:broad specificity phosphatase PhoE
MKWPRMIVLIRHGKSAYNALKEQKEKDSLYTEFKAEYEKNYRSSRARELAKCVQAKYALGIDDYATPLILDGNTQSHMTGRAIQRILPLPDVIYCSPYIRARETLYGIRNAWPELNDVKAVFDDNRIVEQDHGLALLYNDWRVFYVMCPEQKEFYDLRGAYWYQYPQGESVSNVRDRARSITTTFIREHAGQVVFVVTHHLTILSMLANYNRWLPEEFLRMDYEEKPKNCGVTVFKCDPDQGSDGRLVCEYYNRIFY